MPIDDNMHGIIEEEELEDEGSDEDEDPENNWNSQTIIHSFILALIIRLFFTLWPNRESSKFFTYFFIDKQLVH